MTCPSRLPWLPLNDVRAMTPGKRVEYVRKNLLRADGKNRDMSQDEFAALVGARSGRQAVIAWEKEGSEWRAPREFAPAIEKITPYPAALFLRAGVEGASVESLALLLQSLEATVERTGAATTSALQDLEARLRRVERALKLPVAQASGV